MTGLIVSVAICTRNNAGSLARSLESVLADRPTTQYELIVVDNGSTDDTASVVERRAASTNVPVRYLYEPKLGLSSARNCALASARGEIMLFTDDDVLVRAGWVDAIAAAFADPEVGVVGGRILPHWQSEPPEWLNGSHATALTLVDLGETTRLFTEDEWVLGANFAVRVELARRFDPPFNPRLGHQGGRRIAHEEVLLANQIRASSRALYCAEAIVVHHVDPSRVSLPFLRASFFDMGVGFGRRTQLERRPQVDIARRLVRFLRMYRRGEAGRRRDGPRTGEATRDELLSYLEAGRYLELLVGRWPWLSDRLSGALSARLRT